MGRPQTVSDWRDAGRWRWPQGLLWLLAGSSSVPEYESYTLYPGDATTRALVARQAERMRRLDAAGTPPPPPPPPPPVQPMTMQADVADAPAPPGERPSSLTWPRMAAPYPGVPPMPPSPPVPSEFS